MATTDNSDGSDASTSTAANPALRPAVDQPADPDESGFLHRYRRWRAGLEHRPAARKLFRTVVGVVGTLVLIVGVIAIPYPGPGWLIVFTGLGILASEFEWAQSVLHWVRGKYDIVMGWYLRQNLLVRGLGALLTCAVVVLTVWLLGAVGFVASWLGIDRPWMHSPLPWL